jgi:hypothetical protein
MGLGLVAYAVFVALQWISQVPAEPLNAGLIVAFSLLWGIVLLACSRALLRRRRWARAPLVTSLLLLLTVGWLLATGTGAEVGFGWAILGVSGCGTVALLTPSVGRELGPSGQG